jgi:Ca2+-binding EF-hand superfamily protein
VSDAIFDGKLELTPAQETSLKRSFQLYDKDRDGVLDFTEIQQVGIA